MNAIRPSRKNMYTGSPLDRMAERRTDAEWIADAIAAETALVVPLWRTKSLLRSEQAPAAVFVEPTGALRNAVEPAEWVFLGMWSGRPVFTVDLSATEEPAALLPPDHGAFGDLRGIASLLPAGEASILAHARGLLHWRSRTRFCSVCGAPCEPTGGGHVMHCTGCGTDHFPRTDPAVIMLVTRGDSILLGHASRFPTAMYSTLAGFVEPGESLEEAVAREVYEETGIRVGHVAYHSSQPWPFPASLMLGFYAEGLTEEITLHDAELADARWFTRAMCLSPDEHGFQLPGGDSIARRLVEDWLAHPVG
jgi:NAD+ diphosphatase